MTENYEKIKQRVKQDDGTYLLQGFWTPADAVEFDDGQMLDKKIQNLDANIDTLNSTIVTKVDKSAITTTLDATSTDEQIPGALTVFNAIDNIDTEFIKRLEKYSPTEPTNGANYWLELY